MRLISLLYHDVVAPGEAAASGFQGAGADLYKLERADFDQHLDGVARAIGFDRLFTLADILSRRQVQHAVLLTFDDGGVGAARHTGVLLERRGWRGHFFITTSRIGQPGFLSREQIRALHEKGHFIGSHSVSHPPRMSHLGYGEMCREWRESAAVLSDIVGARVACASVPGGFYSREVARAAAQAGITVLWNSEPTTKVEWVDGCMVLGRYSVKRGMSAQHVRCLARGDRTERFAQLALWNAKKVAKAVGGEHWLAMRKMVLSRKEKEYNLS